jgi:Fe-S-cluster containining protein
MLLLSNLTMGVTEKLDQLWNDLSMDYEIRRIVQNVCVVEHVSHMRDKRGYDCSACNPRKCCAYGVPVLVYDLARLVDAGLGDYVTGKFKFIEGRGKSETDDVPHTKIKNSVCALFKDGKCSQYDARPVVCRTYPYFASHERHDRGTVVFDDADCVVTSEEADHDEIWKNAKDFELEVIRMRILLGEFDYHTGVLCKRILKKFIRANDLGKFFQ